MEDLVYRIIQKMITLIELFYLQLECTVFSMEVRGTTRMNHLTNPVAARHWLDHERDNMDKPKGIQLTLFQQLEDFNFADDVALLSSMHVHLQEKPID